MKDILIWLEKNDATGTAVTLALMVFFFGVAVVIRWRQTKEKRSGD